MATKADDDLKGLFEVWNCPRRCGWYRTLETKPRRQEKVVEHPLYGNVTSQMTGALDITKHDCIESLHALYRLHIRQGRTSRGYAYTEPHGM